MRLSAGAAWTLPSFMDGAAVILTDALVPLHLVVSAAFVRRQAIPLGCKML